MTIHNSDDKPITPSVVLLGEDGHVLVGPSFERISIEDPSHIVEAIKRQMGNKDFYIVYQNKRLTPEFISALIMKKLKQDCEKRIGPIANAVITVPYYFNDIRRKATQDAGQDRRAQRRRHPERADGGDAGVRLDQGGAGPRRSAGQGKDDPGLRPGGRNVRRHGRPLYADQLPRAGDRRRRDARRARLDAADRRPRLRAVQTQVRRRSAGEPRDAAGLHPGVRRRQAAVEHPLAGADQPVLQGQDPHRVADAQATSSG